MRKSGTSSAQITAKAPGRGKLALGTLLAAIIAVQGGALLLKAWEERQSADLAQAANVQRETLAVAERLAGQAEAALAGLRVAHRTGSPLAAIESELSGIDVVIPLSDASFAGDGGRLRAGANMAAQLLDANTNFGLSASGDMVVVHQAQGGPALLALGAADAWLPRLGGGQALTVRGAVTRSTGSSELIAQMKSSGGPSVAGNPLGSRTVQACVQMRQSLISVCSARRLPALQSIDLVRLVIYLLLLLAPALALFGVFSTLKRERKTTAEAEKAQAQTQHVFDLAMEGAEAGVWHWKTNSRTGEFSEAAQKLIGLRVADIHSIDDYLDRVHPNDRKETLAAIENSPQLGRLEVVHRLADTNTPVWVELKGRSTTQPVNGSHRHFAGIVVNVTDRKRAEIRVTQAEHQLRNAVDGFSGPFAIWDKKKRLLYWNTAFERTFNLEDTLRRGMGRETVAAAQSPAIRQERPAETEPNTTVIKVNDGRWIKMVERITPDGGLLTIGIDLTETVKSHEALAGQKQKLARLVDELERSEGHAAELARKYSEQKAKAEHAANSKSAFLANMSHELRTPLNAINGFSEILANELYGSLGDARYKEYANDILISGQHLLDMINDILDMAKIEAGKMTVRLEKIDPVEPVDAAIRMIRRKAEDKGISLILNAANDLPMVDADHRAVKQMVLNLISNAIKFTEEGGRIAVTIRAQDDMLRIAVTDTGVGIPEAHLPRLARPFEQVDDTRDRQFGGTGLGLALTKSFAEMHGGKLAIASEVGRGTTVAIYLPLNQTNTEGARAVA